MGSPILWGSDSENHERRERKKNEGFILVWTAVTEQGNMEVPAIFEKR